MMRKARSELPDGTSDVDRRVLFTLRARSEVPPPFFGPVAAGAKFSEPCAIMLGINGCMPLLGSHTFAYVLLGPEQPSHPSRAS